MTHSCKKADLENIKAIITHIINVEGYSLYKSSFVDDIFNRNEFLQFDLCCIKKAHAELVKDCPITRDYNDIDYHDFTFIDLFSGIGGFRLALEELDGKCVFSSEINSFAKKTYFSNFGDVPFGDITLHDTKKLIPHNYDILCAGFPCQPFSYGGLKLGFDDVRGTLFFEIADIIKQTNPNVIFLENVKGLMTHDKGRTLKTILSILRDELGYYVPEPKLFNSKHFGVPQNRERVIIVGFKKNLGGELFTYPVGSDSNITVNDILEKHDVDSKYYISKVYLNYMESHKKRHSMMGHGFGYEILNRGGVANTLTVGGSGLERNLIEDVSNNATSETSIRKLTPRECARLQGYPDTFKIPVSNLQAYKQFGNSVTVPLIKAIGYNIVEILHKWESENG